MLCNNKMTTTTKNSTVDEALSSVLDEYCGTVYKIMLPKDIKEGKMIEAKLPDGQQIIYKISQNDVSLGCVILTQDKLICY